MKKETIFRKVLVSERLPTVYGEYNTDMGLMEYSPYPGNGWLCYPNPEPEEYWLEEIQLPSEEEIERESIAPFKNWGGLREEYDDFIKEDSKIFLKGANFILNHLKSNTNETDKI